MELHPTQKKLLNFLENNRDGDLTLRSIGQHIGVSHPQQIQHHLLQLEKKGFLRKDLNGSYSILKTPIEDVAFIPHYGFAQCGPNAMVCEEENLIDRIPMSTRFLGITSVNDYFFLQARGDSMQPNINEGDFVLIKSQDYFDEERVYALLHKGVPKIKKIALFNSKYALISDNSFYSIEFVEESDIRIIGVIKRIVRSF